MSIKVRINHFLQESTDGREMVEVTGKTVGECLDDLEAQFPSIKNQLGMWKGQEFKLFPDILIYVNLERLYPEELAEPVKDGDELALVVMAVGG